MQTQSHRRFFEQPASRKQLKAQQAARLAEQQVSERGSSHAHCNTAMANALCVRRRAHTPLTHRSHR